MSESTFRRIEFFEFFLFFLSFTDLERKTVGLLSKTTQQDCKKCFPLVQWKLFEEEQFFLNSSLSHLVPIFGKMFKLFVGKISAVLSKLQSTYPFELFMEKCIVFKDYVFLTTVGVRTKDFGLFAKNFR